MIGAIAGGQLLEQTNSGESHAAVNEKVTLGRTVFGGLSFGRRWRRYSGGQALELEAVIGRYSNDRLVGCVSSYSVGEGRFVCSGYDVETFFAVLYNLQYAVWLGGSRRAPFLSIGVGGKSYSLGGSQWGGGRGTSVALHGGLGVELGERRPIRLETRLVAVLRNPYLLEGAEFQGSGSTTQLELQVRAGIRLPIQ